MRRKITRCAQRASITLEDVAEYPISITYHAGFTGRNAIDEAFTAGYRHLDVVMSALDADVIKTYVELGLGVGIIASMAYHPDKATAACAC